MNWYYAQNNQQQGPISDAEFADLVNSGIVTDQTLVWHEGLANWQPYASIKPASMPLAPEAPLAAGAVSVGEVVCVECRKAVPQTEAIPYGGAWVCAACKPAFFQKRREGVPFSVVGGGRRPQPVNPDQLVQEILSRGVELDIGSCISRGWNLVKANLWLVVGTTFLSFICMQGSGIIPIVGICLSLALNGPLLGGLYLFFLKLIRGEQATVGDAFSGFQRFLPLAGVFLLMMLLVYLPLIPAVAYGGLTGQFGRGGMPNAIFFVLAGVGLLGAMYFGVTLFYAVPLVMDMGLGPVDALQVSRKVVSSRFLTFFAFGLVCGLIMAVGLIGLCVGVIFTLPIGYAAWMYAYEDVFGAPPQTPTA